MKSGTDECVFKWVVNVLRNARGEANAMTLDQISEHLHVQRRELEHLIETRLPDWPYPICSTGKGYFVPVSADEANASRHYKVSRFAKLQARVDAEQAILLRHGFKMENGRFVSEPQQAELFGRN